ncbi:MAG TPA: type II toxin-antitoxin system VapC family toxin [bacterium]|nr:type II toxin-antitoxin system VapC family toxin [bacterium]
MVVVDTSVAIKWFFDEAGSSEARSLLRDEVLGAPDLLYYEFSNYLCMKDFVTPEETGRFVDQLYALPLQVFLLPQKGFRRAVELAKRFRLTAYDASFVALAEALDANLVTADAKLVQKLKSLSFVKLLPGI